MATGRNRNENDRALRLVLELIEETAEGDPRRRALYQLRNQIIKAQGDLKELEQERDDLKETVEILEQPLNRIAVLIDPPQGGLAYVIADGSNYYCRISPSVDAGTLAPGKQVLLNMDEFEIPHAVVGDLGYPKTGPVEKVFDVLKDGRFRVGPDNDPKIVRRSGNVEGQQIKVGDEARIDPSGHFIIEVFPRKERQGRSEYELHETPDEQWGDIGGQEKAVQGIREAIEMPLLHPELFDNFQFQASKGFLLYGPPGCGKTLIGKALANSLASKLRGKDGKRMRGAFFHIKGPEIFDRWHGEQERKIREIFEAARQKRKKGFLPVIFIDEAESLLSVRRQTGGYNSANHIVPLFCAELDGIQSAQDVVIILASNRPDMIDPAVMRPGRIDRKIKVERPDKEGARSIFRVHLADGLPIHPDETRESLIDKAVEDLWEERGDTRVLNLKLANGRRETLHRKDLVSGALIAAVAQRAKETALKRSIDENKPSYITAEDLIEAIAAEFQEGEIFPAGAGLADWLRLIDKDAENVESVSPAHKDDSEYDVDEADAPKVEWDEIGGQGAAIQEIRDAIEMPLLHPDLFEEFQYEPPKGFLLYGPPGCGKTLIGKAAAHNLAAKLQTEDGKPMPGAFIHIKGPELKNKWVGESERNIREIFASAREKRKNGSMPFIFFDEADAVFGIRRDTGMYNHFNTIVPMLLAELDGIQSLQDVVVILATNRPDMIDPAVMRPGRIDRKIKVVRPDKEASRRIFQIHFAEDLPIHPDETRESLIDQAIEELWAKRDDTRFLELELNDGHRETLYRRDFVSGALIAAVVQRAKQSAIKRSIADEKRAPIAANDLIEAVASAYQEDEIFPTDNNLAGWLRLLDKDPEQVAAVYPVSLQKSKSRQRWLEGSI